MTTKNFHPYDKRTNHQIKLWNNLNLSKLFQFCSFVIATYNEQNAGSCMQLTYKLNCITKIFWCNSKFWAFNPLTCRIFWELTSCKNDNNNAYGMNYCESKIFAWKFHFFMKKNTWSSTKRTGWFKFYSPFRFQFSVSPKISMVSCNFKG